MNESKYLQNTHFYIPDEYVSAMAQDANGNLSIFVGPNFSFDIIEQPFHCVIASVEGAIDFNLYVRSEMGAFLENPDLGVKLFKEPQEGGKQLKVTANTGRIGDAGEILGIFLKVVEGISIFAERKELVTDLSNIDTESEGFLVKLDGDELSFNKVSGKARPDMACTTLFGGVQMMRPYQNEIMDSWMGEMMSIEEKTELAEDGDEDMMEQLAMTYLNGDDEVDVDTEKAVYWFTRLAELDNATAQFNLGLLCAKGFGMERNFETAVNWLQKAEENGDDDARGLIEKLQKAVTAEKIVSSGDAQAQADLAEVYMFIGNSLDQADPDADYAIALEYARKSAEQNNGDGLWALALAYEHGRGVEQDVDKAIECYRKGADLGHAPSQHSLACYYFRGDVLEEDHEKAFALCMKSAEQGYGLAMRDVGRAYQFGNGVDDDMSLAIEWYEKALAVINDPELEQKVAVFKMLEEGGSFAEDSEEDDDDGDGGWGMPDGMMEAIDLQDFAEEAGYKIETNANGVFTIGDEKMIAFVMDIANDGNEDAKLVLAKYFLTNECTDEQNTQAIAWMKELAANGNEDAQDILEDLE